MAKARAAKRKKAVGEALRRCSGTMTEAQYLAWIRSSLRSKWLRWPPRAEALRAAQVPYVGDNPRRKYSYKCAICSGLFASKDVSVDHFPIEAGSILSVDDIGQFCNNLYCEVDNLRVLCDPCHATHTLSQALGITFEQARQEKRVIDFLKKPVKEVVAYCCHMGYTQQQLSNADKRRAAVAEILSRDTGVELESVV